MSIIAHSNYNKSTLTNSLIAKAGINAEGETGNSSITNNSLYYESDVKGQNKLGYLINLIDSPSLADFSPEVTETLRVIDGVLIVVDYVEGLTVQTETVLHQALGEKI